MAEKVSRKITDKWKTKKWFKIIAPKMFNEQEIGETPAQKPQLVEGRVIKIVLGKLTGDRKAKHIEVKFKVSDVQGDRASTVVIGHEVRPSYIGRLVRRRKSKIDAIATVKTKDGKKARITAVTVCGTKVDRSIETKIRKIMLDELNSEAPKKDFDELFQEYVSGNTSSKIFKASKDLAPIKRIEVTKSKLL